MAITTAIASSTGAGDLAVEGDRHRDQGGHRRGADQICRTISETPGKRSPTSTIASSAAARPAAISAATIGASATDAHSTGNTPATVSSAIATRLPVDRQQYQRPGDGKHGRDAAAAGQPRELAVADPSSDQRDRAAGRSAP